MDENQFTKGFNNGYFLSEHQPELLNTLVQGITSSDSAYLEGLKEGQKQKQNELERERIKNSIGHTNQSDKSKNRGR